MTIIYPTWLLAPKKVVRFVYTFFRNGRILLVWGMRLSKDGPGGAPKSRMEIWVFTCRCVDELGMEWTASLSHQNLVEGSLRWWDPLTTRDPTANWLHCSRSRITSANKRDLVNLCSHNTCRKWSLCPLCFFFFFFASSFIMAKTRGTIAVFYTVRLVVVADRWTGRLQELLLPLLESILNYFRTKAGRHGLPSPSLSGSKKWSFYLLPPSPSSSRRRNERASAPVTWVVGLVHGQKVVRHRPRVTAAHHFCFVYI